MINKTVLFSGRFDNVHPGHIATIQRIGQIYKKVLVVILDYPDQVYPLIYRYQVLRQTLMFSKGDYEVIVDKTHFGKITKKELEKFDFNVYASGNLDVLKHISDLGYEVMYTERAFDYSASAIKSLTSNISPIKNV
jgi:phosphopantetheine adenylyltransferase